MRINVKVSPGKMINTIGTDYIFVFEQVLTTCCAKFRKEQAKKIIEICQEPIHEIKVRGFSLRGEVM
jgi:hypothetical protein